MLTRCSAHMEQILRHTDGIRIRMNSTMTSTIDYGEQLNHSMILTMLPSIVHPVTTHASLFQSPLSHFPPRRIHMTALTKDCFCLDIALGSPGTISCESPFSASCSKQRRFEDEDSRLILRPDMLRLETIRQAFGFVYIFSVLAKVLGRDILTHI